MADRPEDNDRHRWREPNPSSPDVSYGRHYSEGGRWRGGAPWGSRGEDRYPLPDAAGPPADRPAWRADPRPVQRADGPPTGDFRRTEPPRHDERDHPRGWLGRMSDEVRGRSAPDRVERRTIAPAGWRDDDDRPDRFDVEIADAVAAKLGRDRRLDASHIEIAVYHGEVELNGSVLSKEGRRRAKHLAEEVPGVRDVDNHLRVEPWR